MIVATNKVGCRHGVGLFSCRPVHPKRFPGIFFKIEKAWKEWPENWNTDISWLRSELNRFWSWPVDFPNLFAIWRNEKVEFRLSRHFVEITWKKWPNIWGYNHFHDRFFHGLLILKISEQFWLNEMRTIVIIIIMSYHKRKYHCIYKTIINLPWDSLYLSDDIFILNLGPDVSKEFILHGRLMSWLQVLPGHQHTYTCLVRNPEH